MKKKKSKKNQTNSNLKIKN